MNVLSKMMNTIKDGLNDVGEQIIDSQALRILDREIRESSEELKFTKDSLLELLAKQHVSKQKSKDLRKAIKEHESYALKALEKNDDDLALEVAKELSKLQQELKDEKEVSESLRQNITQLRNAVNLGEKNIRFIKQQLDTIKATDNVQKAQETVLKRYDGSNIKLRTAMNSLKRIKERQAQAASKLDSANDLSKEEKSLSQKLEEAGIKPRTNSPDEILKRLKKNDIH